MGAVASRSAGGISNTSVALIFCGLGMLMVRIVFFLLDTLFFVLVGAALLRGWMNAWRITLRGPLGQVVMALTDWLVKPLRRALPAQVRQSRMDAASVLMAALMSLLYAALLVAVMHGWVAGPMASVLGAELGFAVGLVALKMLLRVALQLMFILVLAEVVLSWVQPYSPARQMLGALTEPVLIPLRRVLPPVGGIDLTAFVVLLLLQVGMMALG